MAEKDNLKILIAGAGIAGLTAALGLRQQGHEVILFERSRLAKEVGAAIHLAPNCHGILKRFGICPDTFGANPVHGFAQHDAQGNLLAEIPLTQALSIWQHSWLLSHRVSLHEALKTKATEVDGLGPPAVIRTSCRVVEVDVATATVTLDDGTTVSGDLVLGADGVSSVTRRAVVGDQLKPFGSGKSAFRFMVPCNLVKDNPVTAHLAQHQGILRMWNGKDRRLVMYPCSDNTIMNFVGIHPSELTASVKGEGYNRGASREVLLDVYKSFGPTVKALLEMVDVSELNVWTLLDMDRIPSWVNGRLALMGDAAHPFLPHQGQGGAIAIEDAASICALLPLGTRPDDIPERLALYEKLRDERAHKVQELTRIAGADLNDKSRGTFNAMEFTNFNFGHDEWDNSTHALRKLLWSKNGPVYWRSPMSFGPLPSPRQNHFGQPIPGRDARFLTHSVRFKTSATKLKTLLPEGFSFTSPGTIAEASFGMTELDKLDWLGGGGYRFFGFWIHGVEYRKSDGTMVKGSFLPVLFENLADPILTGRDELGMPKLYSDIDVFTEGSTTRISCSWRGTKYVSLQLHGIQDGSSNETTINGANGDTKKDFDDGNTLVYRSLPSVGSRGASDAAYPVIIRENASQTPKVVETIKRGSGASIDCQPGTWKTLPTLHHIASWFAEMPIYNVGCVKVEEGRGVDPMAHVERVE